MLRLAILALFLSTVQPSRRGDEIIDFARSIASSYKPVDRGKRTRGAVPRQASDVSTGQSRGGDGQYSEKADKAEKAKAEKAEKAKAEKVEKAEKAKAEKAEKAKVEREEKAEAKKAGSSS